VPHSQCSLGEKLKFFQNFRPKNNTVKGNIFSQFSFNIYHSILGLTFKGKNYYSQHSKSGQSGFPMVTNWTGFLAEPGPKFF
jgi:hypothetical protein